MTFYRLRLALPIIAACIISACSPTRHLHVLNPASPDELHRLSEYQPHRMVISGHRGTTELGLPENAIASMHAALQHTPAFFEIDHRLPKDNVLVVLHAATLDRTPVGTDK